MARRERFTMPPRALSPQFKGQASRQLTAVDHQRIAMQRLRMEENARVKNMAELHAELFDMTYLTETDDYGFPIHTPYEVSDAVSSVYVAPSFEEKQTEEQNSVKTPDSAPNPAAGTE